MSVRLSIHMKKADLAGLPTKEDEMMYEIFNEETHPIDVGCGTAVVLPPSRA
jgi:hypothetical protein